MKIAGNSTELYKEQDVVLASLCAKAPSVEIRDCLRKYCPRKRTWQLENTFKQMKKHVLVDSLAYLGRPEMDQYKAEFLPKELICRIQNLFPDVCNICDAKYCVQLNEKTIASCARCGQGCHNSCFLKELGMDEDSLDEENNYGGSVINPYGKLGLFYLCGYCKNEVIPDKEAQKVKQKKERKVSKPSFPPAVSSPVSTTASDHNQKTQDEKAEESTDSSEKRKSCTLCNRFCSMPEGELKQKPLTSGRFIHIA